MNANCPNFSNKQVKKEFDELVDVFGEDTAYFLWNKNEGYSLDKAPNGADSSLFQSLLNNYKGDRSKALVEAAKQLIANPTEEQQDEIYENNKYLSEQIINYLKHIGYNIHDIEDSLELFNKNPNLSKTIQYIKTSNKKVLGFVYNNEIYIDKSKFTPETLLHEYTHIWDIAVAKRNPKLWDRGVELMKNTYLWEEIKNSEQYGKLWEANGKSKKELDDLIASEVHSRLVGKNGENIINSIVKKEGNTDIISKLKQWLNDFWKNLIETFGNVTKQELDNLTIDDFNNMTLRDFVKGVKLNDQQNFKRNSNGQLLAPNGKVSHLSEKQYAQVRTIEFKNWFGDWENDPKNASKVVDENGEPLVVYHGSNNDNLTIFKNKSRGS